jgi:hypothetical protein
MQCSNKKRLKRAPIIVSSNMTKNKLSHDIQCLRDLRYYHKNYFSRLSYNLIMRLM